MSYIQGQQYNKLLARPTPYQPGTRSENKSVNRVYGAWLIFNITWQLYRGCIGSLPNFLFSYQQTPRYVHFNETIVSINCDFVTHGIRTQGLTSTRLTSCDGGFDRSTMLPGLAWKNNLEWGDRRKRVGTEISFLERRFPIHRPLVAEASTLESIQHGRHR